MVFNEETLDPQNWDKFRKLGHHILDEQLDFLQNIRNQPFTPLSENSIKAIQTPLPQKGEGEEKVYNLFKEHVARHNSNWVSPEFWGFVAGTGSPYGMLTEMLLSAINHGSMIHTHIAKQSLSWIKEMLEYPSKAGGVLVSGGSEANFTGLAVARNMKAEIDAKKDGVQMAPRKMTLYCSEETHGCLDRSVELLGLGNDALRWIKTDDSCKIVIKSLKESIKKDRREGKCPFCIIGNAGTVNSGAFDGFNELADLALEENMWLHVDGAFGSWVKISSKYKHLADGLERADSVAVDLHKWMSMPYGIACTLVKDRLALFRTFVYGHDAEYINSFRGAGEAVDDQWNLSLSLSRPHYGLKAYMLLRAFGCEKYSKIVEQNIDQIHYLAELMKNEPNIEVTAPVVSNIVCFRYIQEGLDENDVEGLNRSILYELWKFNEFMITDTTIKGKYMLRACNVNHRSLYSDFNILLERIKSIGKTLAKEYS